MQPIPNALIEVNRMQEALLDVKSELDLSEQRIDRERSLLKETVQAMPVGVVIRISMDGRGRWMDNVFIERLWRY